MKFAGLSVTGLVAAALVAAAVVVALHMLRRTPRAQTVSHLEFWRRAAERSKPRALFATRIPWLAMLLALAIAMLIVGEIGDPRIGTGFSGTTVIVLDADRSMGARDENGHRRLDDAMTLVREIVQADTVTGQVAIVRAGVRNEVVVPLTHRAADADRALVRGAVDDGTADLDAAVSLARGIVRQAHTAGRVVVLADRDDFARTTQNNIPVVLDSIGAPGETIAITALDARRDPNALGEYYVRCEIRSYSAHPARVHLVIRDRDTTLSEEQIVLRPGEVKTHRAHGFSSAQAELTARIEDIEIEGGRDALAADDVAYAAVAPVVATRVLLVTNGNRFLQAALGANPSVQLETAGPDALTRNDLGRFQVLVLDRIAAPATLDHPAVMLVGATDSRTLRTGNEVRGPRITAVATDHRVFSGLRFDQVQIARSRTLVAESDDRVLVRSGRDALAIARERNGNRVLALGFDTEGSDLVRRIAFPLFVHNSLVWLDRRERAFHSWQSPGESIRAAGDPAVVLTSTGDAVAVRGSLHDTMQSGIYHSADRAVAVSAADQSGSLVALEGTHAPHPRAPRGKPPLAMILAGVVLVLIAVEWALVQRGRVQ